MRIKRSTTELHPQLAYFKVLSAWIYFFIICLFQTIFIPFVVYKTIFAHLLKKIYIQKKRKQNFTRIRTSAPVGDRFHKTPLRYYFLPIHTISSLLSSPTIIQNMPSLPILTYQKQLEIHMTFRTVHATAFTSINLFSLNIFTFLFRYSQSVRS